MDGTSLVIRLKAATPPNLRAAHNVELSIPQTAGRNALRKLLYHLLSLPESSRPQFHFLANGNELRTTFDKFLERRGLSAEATVDVTYYIPLPEPKSDPPLQPSQEWLSSVHAHTSGTSEEVPLTLVGSYSGAPAINRGDTSVVPEENCLPLRHAAPIKAVAWLRDGNRFLTASQDQTACLWSMDEESASATPIARFLSEDSGDAVSLTTVAVSVDGAERAALGADDGSVWLLPDISQRAPKHTVDGDRVGTPKRKASDTSALSAVRIGGATVPLPVSSVEWRTENVVSAGWDALVRTWDVNACTPNLTIPCGGKAVTDISVAENTILVAAVDGAVRIVDARDGKGVVAACGMKGAHKGVVSGVRWLEEGRNGLSGGYDGTVKFWDMRSMVSPARVVTKVHNGEKSLAVDAFRRKEQGDWLVFSAGADGKLARIIL